MSMRKFKNPTGGFGIALFGLLTGLTLGGLYVADAFTSPPPKPKPKPDNGGGDNGGGDNGDGDNGGSDNGRSDTLPDYKPVPGKKYARGPNGKGRVYGKPNIALPDALFASNKVLVGPNCLWVVEGELFLPPVGHSSYSGQEREESTLLNTLQDETDEVLPTGAGSANQAWGFISFLANRTDGILDADALAQRLFDDGAFLWKRTLDSGRHTAGLPVNGFVCAGSSEANLPQPLKDWRADMKSRIGGWLNAYFNIPFDPNSNS